MGEQDAWREHQLHQQQHNAESTSSSLEILRTLNISFAAGDYHSTAPAAYCDSAQDYNADATKDHQSLRLKHTESFLQKERIFIAQLIAKATEICPTIFGKQGTAKSLSLSFSLATLIFTRVDGRKSGEVDINAYIVRGLRLLWSYVGIILDHILLWWIDTPMSCYNLTHIDSIRCWLFHQSVNGEQPLYRETFQ